MAISLFTKCTVFETGIIIKTNSYCLPHVLMQLVAPNQYYYCSLKVKCSSSRCEEIKLMYVAVGLSNAMGVPKLYLEILIIVDDV